MPFFSRLRRWSLLAGCGAITGFFLTQSWRQVQGSEDPDRYYHLALAYDWQSTSGLFLRSLPQVEGLGWGSFFPDKEPFFHVLTGLAYQLAGEPGVFFLPVALASILLFLLSKLVLRADRLYGRAITLALISAALLTQPWFFLRLSMLRPHTLALVLFFSLFLVLERQKKIWVFSVCGLFALSYHAVYIPVALLVLSSALQWQVHRSWKSATSLGIWGLAGLTLGSVLSPSFPGNLVMMFRHLQIALFEVSGAKLNFGNELYPWSTSVFLSAHLGTLVLFGLLIRESIRSQWKNRQLSFPLYCAAIFFLLSFQSPRAQEYLVPAILVAAGRLALLWKESKESRVSWLALILAVASPAFLSKGWVSWKPKAPMTTLISDSEWVRALRALPEKNPRIFNMEWDVSPLVLYARPDVRVVDLLDPSFLLQHDRPLHEARTAIARAAIVDAQGYLTESFQADYVLTKSEELGLRFDKDPLLERVFPTKDTKYRGNERLFRLAPKTRQHLVSDFNPTRGAKGIPVSQFSRLTPESSLLKPLSHLLPQNSVYLDLTKLFDQPKDNLTAPAGSLMQCVLLEPSSKERDKWAGRSILGVGGGRNVRIWLNRRPFYHSITMSPSAEVVHQLVDFGRPLRREDQIQVIVCSRESSPVFGLSLSWWTEQEIEDLCFRKQWMAPETLEDERPWRRLGRSRLSCLGDFATPPMEAKTDL